MNDKLLSPVPRVALRKAMGERLRKLRKSNDLTQHEMADLFDVTPSMISNIERGISFMSVFQVYILSKHLGVDPNFLIAGQGDTSLTPNANRMDILERRLQHLENLIIDRDSDQ
ncbi:MAG: helix-turn-helix transcriptional regulator [Bacteroidota bacterium]